MTGIMARFNSRIARISCPVLLCSLACCLTAQAEVRLAMIFGDHMVLQRDVPVPVWGTAAAGEKISVSFGDEAATTTAGSEGSWSVKLRRMPTDAHGRTLRVAGSGNAIEIKDVLVGDVWVTGGQSNMQRKTDGITTRSSALRRASNDQLRMYFGANSQEGWQECTPETADAFSAVGYLFGSELQRRLGIPVGLIYAAVGGTQMEYWTDRAVIINSSAFAPNLERGYKIHQSALTKGEDPALKDPRRKLGAGYRNKVAPLMPFAISGVLWYQGESNAGDAFFDEKLKTLMTSWRQAWGQGDFPFLVVQLPPWANRTGHYYPMTWSCQRKAVDDVPNAALITGIQAASWLNIHPPNKEPLGRLAALQALRLTGRSSNLVTQGPSFQTIKTEARRALVTFGDVGSGLVARTRKMVGFSLAGADGRFVAADALWTPRGVVEVSSSRIPRPASVRYEQRSDTHVETVEWTAARIAEEEKKGEGDGEKRALAANRGDRILIDLDLIGGDRPAEECTDGTLEGFEICGHDGLWKPAEARIASTDTVTVSSTQVTEPVAIRYGWYAEGTTKPPCDFMPASLWNREGLPAAPFSSVPYNPVRERKNLPDEIRKFFEADMK